jgi:hypothetical protein
MVCPCNTLIQPPGDKMHNNFRFKMLVYVAAAAMLPAAQAQHRQQEVAQRGATVMPFTLSATTHVFTKSADGGVQRVIAKAPGDKVQVQAIRAHLSDIATLFSRGDFSAPLKIHGADMPGLAQLRAAPPGRITIKYRELPAGAEIAYATSDPALTKALHLWFDAQLSDHGHDALAGEAPARHHSH